MGERLARGWDRTWFTPEPALTMVFLRWLVLGVLAADTWRRRSLYRGMPDRPSELWEPISFLGWLPTPQPTEVVIEVLLVAVAVGVVISLAGWLPRAGAGLAGIAILVLTAMLNSFGKVNHDQQMLVFMVLVVALAAAPRPDAPDSWRFRWPIQTSRLVMALMLFSAGAAKLAIGGPDWVLSSSMRNILVTENLLFRDPPLQEVALWIATEPWRWRLAAAGAVAGELVLVVAVVARRPWIRGLAALAGVGTLVGITLLMGLVGFPIVALGAVFAQPGAILRRYRDGAGWALPAAVTLAGLTVLVLTALTVAPIAALPLVIATIVTLLAARRALASAPPDVPVLGTETRRVG
jgi:hypothetical protein